MQDLKYQVVYDKIIELIKELNHIILSISSPLIEPNIEYIISKRNNKYHINFPQLIVNKQISCLIINQLKEISVEKCEEFNIPSSHASTISSTSPSYSTPAEMVIAKLTQQLFSSCHH